MKYIKTFEQYLEDKNSSILEKDEITRWWALFAHISDHFVKAKNTKELMKKFIEAQKKSYSSPKGWPIAAIKYFYSWHLDKIKDKQREKKAELMQAESVQYYNEHLKPLND